MLCVTEPVIQKRQFLNVNNALALENQHFIIIKACQAASGIKHL